MHQHPGTARAHLPGSSPHGAHRRRRRGIEIGVGKDDERALATELERHPLDSFGRGGLDCAASGDGAGERDGVDLGVFDKCLSDVPASALHDVEDAGRESGIECDLGHQHGGHRRLLGRLEDDRVARRQRGGNHGEHCGRPVPGHDQADDPDGFAHLRHVELAGHCGDGSLELRGPSTEVLDAVHGELHDEPGVHPQQTGVEHVDLTEQLTALGDEGCHLAQHLLLRHRGLVPPATVLERDTGGTGSAIHVAGGTGGGLRDDVAGRRIDDVQGRAIAGANEFTLDDVTEDVTLDGSAGRRRHPKVDDGHGRVRSWPWEEGPIPHVPQEPQSGRLTS